MIEGSAKNAGTYAGEWKWSIMADFIEGAEINPEEASREVQIAAEYIEECGEIAVSEDYADYIFGAFAPAAAVCNVPLTFQQRISYIPLERARNQGLLTYGYQTVPKLYGLMDEVAMERSGIAQLQNQEYLQLRGKGILIGVIDTGIDYQNPVFLDTTGRSRIIRIWDQTQKGNGTSTGLYYGREYTTEQLMDAMEGTPVTTDEIGHGTRMAMLAAGRTTEETPGFLGAAPESQLVVVKLKQAKQYLRTFWGVREDVVAFQENDIMLALLYIIRVANELQQPLVLMLGLGSNQGGHGGGGPLGQYLSYLGSLEGIAVVVAAGNEAGKRLHYYCCMEQNLAEAELLVSENNTNFSMEIWTQTTNRFTVEIVTPSGEIVQQIPLIYGQENNIRFSLIPTRIMVYYENVLEAQLRQMALIRMEQAVQGIWKIRIYQEKVQLRTDAWLPLQEFTNGEVAFLQPNPDTTITNPGNSTGVITVSAYEIQNDTIWINSGRGYSGIGSVKPDLAAPGVNILVPRMLIVPGEEPLMAVTGTSYAAAITAGACALLLEWGIIKGNNFNINTAVIQNYLIRGARQRQDILVPDRAWGYGALDLYSTFAQIGISGVRDM